MTSLKNNYRLKFVRNQQEIQQDFRCSHRDIILFADGIKIGSDANVEIWMASDETVFTYQMTRYTQNVLHPALENC